MFGTIPNSAAFRLQSEASSLKQRSEGFRTVNEKHGVFGSVFLVDFFEEPVSQYSYCDCKQPQIAPSV